MVTVLLIVLAVVAVLAIVGGVAMMADNKGSFLTWYFGLKAVEAGFTILVEVLAAVCKGMSEG